MNHGEARHFEPYGPVERILGTVGISVIVGADSVLSVGIHVSCA